MTDGPPKSACKGTLYLHLCHLCRRAELFAAWPVALPAIKSKKPQRVHSSIFAFAASSSTVSLMFVSFFYMFVFPMFLSEHELSTSSPSPSISISCRICLARSFNANFSSKSAKSVMVPSMMPRIWDVTCHVRQQGATGG